jgi:hypothetical protein
LHKSHPYCLQDAVEIAIHVFVREAQHRETLRGKRSRTSTVISYFFVSRMGRSIDLDDQSSVEAGEEAAKDNLTSKSEAADLLATKTFPETSFSGRCIAS